MIKHIRTEDTSANQEEIVKGIERDLQRMKIVTMLSRRMSACDLQLTESTILSNPIIRDNS